MELRPRPPAHVPMPASNVHELHSGSAKRALGIRRSLPASWRSTHVWQAHADRRRTRRPASGRTRTQRRTRQTRRGRSVQSITRYHRPTRPISNQRSTYMSIFRLRNTPNRDVLGTSDSSPFISAPRLLAFSVLEWSRSVPPRECTTECGGLRVTQQVRNLPDR